MFDTFHAIRYRQHVNLRITTVRRGAKVYRYAQLVESYRRESDGKPTCRVVASLGTLDDVAIANLRNALSANRDGQALVVPAAAAAPLTEPEVLDNLQYLDLAVLLRLWEDVGLGPLLRSLLPPSESTTAELERVVAALVLHRCVAAGSTLSAERWFPTTALAELLSVTSLQFNNSRLHRVLTALEAVESQLQDRLPTTVRQHEGEFATVFIDATDTWFEGKGPPLAAKGIDKEGIYRRRIGVVLLCDDRGFPLRWHTLSGRYHDPTVLLEMAKEVAALPWMKGKTVVIDRAAGSAAAVEQLATSQLRFLTALPFPEFLSSGAPIDWAGILALQAVCINHPSSPARIARAATDAGLTRVRDDRYVLDLGVFSKARAKSSRPTAAVAAIQRAQIIMGNPTLSLATLSTMLARPERSLRRDRTLCALLPTLQTRVLAGEADGCNLADLQAVARLPPGRQDVAFDAAIQRTPATRPIRARLKSVVLTPALKTRGVLCFNPLVFVRQQESEREKRKLIDERVERINARLAKPKCTRKDSAILGEIGALVRRMKLGDALSTRLTASGGTRMLVVEYDEAAWARRRRAYGVSILVGHAELAQSAADLVTLYYSKDAVEKDFQTIKSITELRPVHHRTDPKVRAHVTLCMLGLLLDRVLVARSASANTATTAPAALESLRPVHLNRLRHGGRSFYTVTTPSPEQTALLASLGMETLVENCNIRTLITPR